MQPHLLHFPMILSLTVTNVCSENISGMLLCIFWSLRQKLAECKFIASEFKSHTVFTMLPKISRPVSGFEFIQQFFFLLS